LTEYGFFSSMDGDRVYSDIDFANYYKALVSSGVILSSASALQVTAGVNMTLNIGDGGAMLEGRWFRSKEGEKVTLPNANGVNPRYDRVVVRCDYADRKAGFAVISGTPAASPQIPAIVRDGTYFDISLAVVLVGAGTTSISQSAITDTRADKNVCGFVTGLIDQIDTTDLFLQFEEQWLEFTRSLGGANVTITTFDAQAREWIKCLSPYNMWVRSSGLSGMMKVGV